MSLELELLPVDIESLAGWEDEWRQLEQRSPNASPYTTYDWLHAWASVYQPRNLHVARAVTADDGATAALGLIEVDRIRGWRFAGGVITPHRAPLCADGREDGVWNALAVWLRTNPRAWSTLEASGVGQAAQALPGARLWDSAVPCLAVPDSFEAYLASMPSRRRQEIRRRLRRTQEAGVEVRQVPADATESALADFLRLCERRADIKKGDKLLVQLLERVDTCSSIELHVFEVLSEQKRIGISLELVHSEVSYPYNLAWEPDASRLAPGILMALNAVTYAIAHGLRTINLGPGEQTYKLELGFIPETRLMLHAINPSAWGRALRTVGSAYQRLRRP